MKMLVVDDMEVNRMILQHYLEPVADIDFAVNGIQAVQKFNRALEQSAFYDVIFLDLIMPEMDGTRTVVAMRKIEENKKIPQDKKAKILIVTSNPSRENVMKTYKFCQGYLLKPVTAPRLYQKLEEINVNCGVDHSKIEDFLEKYIRKRKRPIRTPDNLETEKKVEQAQEQQPAVKETDAGTPLPLPLLMLKDNRILVGIRKNDPVEESEISVLEYVEAEKYDGFQNVTAGKVFARLESPESGITVGCGIKLLTQKLTLKTSSGGKIIFNGGNVSLSETLALKGPVQGNIEFEGKIKIEGDVRSGSRIKSRGSVEISGKGESCSIESGDGGVSINRLDGKGKAFIICKEDFQASFLYESTVESGGSIKIEKESVGSILKARKAIRIGNAVGGECRAMELVEVKKAGSPKDVNTLLAAGYDFTLTDAIEKIKAEIQEKQNEISKLDGILGPYAETPQTALTLPEHKMEKILKMAAERNWEKYSTLPELQEKLAYLEKGLTASPDSTIIIRESINRGVTLMIGEKKSLIEENLKGSFTVVSGENPNIPDIKRQEK